MNKKILVIGPLNTALSFIKMQVPDTQKLMACVEHLVTLQATKLDNKHVSLIIFCHDWEKLSKHKAINGHIAFHASPTIPRLVLG